MTTPEVKHTSTQKKFPLRMQPLTLKIRQGQDKKICIKIENIFQKIHRYNGNAGTLTRIITIRP